VILNREPHIPRSRLRHSLKTTFAAGPVRYSKTLASRRALRTPATSMVHHTATPVFGPTIWLPGLPRHCPADSDGVACSQASKIAETAFGNSRPGSRTYDSTAHTALAFGSSSHPSSTDSDTRYRETAFDSSRRGSSMEQQHIACIAGSAARSWNRTRRHGFAQETGEATTPENTAIGSWQRLPSIRKTGLH